MLIMGSVLNTFSSLVSFILKLPADNANPAFSNYFYYLASPFSILVGIFLLKLKNWARVATLILSILVAVETVLTTPHVLRQLIAMDPHGAFLTQLVLLIVTGCSLAFNGVMLYYFTRPKTKEQFKQHRTVQEIGKGPEADTLNI